ncbi:MAG TPA: R3H domain-containing nucleic acid-binding protein [Candidatus Polarisedimenticolia bacterium]|nr:R3H domain-containing nucleic acid-binding protein [Candidatus Polarisedimenticolia bacterium]
MSEDDTVETGEGRREPLSAEPGEVAALTERILRGLGLETSVSVSQTDSTIEVELSGPGAEEFVERRGEALNALQYLLNRILYRGRKGKKIHVDSEGFRRLREEEIVEIARLTAEKVKARGEESLLSPMNPYERRLIHLALSEIEGIETRSVGDGFLKRVAILPAGKGPSGPHEAD